MIFPTAMTSSGVNNSKSELNTKFNEMNFDEDVVEDFTALKVVHESVVLQPNIWNFQCPNIR